MGFCSMCGKEIDDTAVICEDCKKLNAEKEDYMDSLLNSMKRENTPNIDISDDFESISDVGSMDDIADYGVDDIMDEIMSMTSDSDWKDSDIDSEESLFEFVEDDNLMNEDINSEKFSDEENKELQELFAMSQDNEVDKEVADNKEVAEVPEGLSEPEEISESEEFEEIDDFDLENFDINNLMTAGDEDEDVFGGLTSIGEDDIQLESDFAPEEMQEMEDVADLGDLLGADNIGIDNLQNDPLSDILSGSDKLSLDGKQNVAAGDDSFVSDNAGDLGDIFSDALSALSSEQEFEEIGEDESIDSALTESMDDVMALLDNTKSIDKKSERPGLFKKLFANIVDDKAIRQAKEIKQAEEAAKQKKLKDEEKKNEQKEEKKLAKAEAKVNRQNAKTERAEKRAEKKEARREARELRALEAEADAEILGRINKVGATVVCVLIGAIALSILFATNMFSYSRSVKQAQTSFDKGLYTDSYNKLLGVDLKEEDQVLYQKVVTVMYVYKQLEAYEVYYDTNDFPMALDALLKGIREYDKHLPEAIELEVTSNLDSVKNQLVTELAAEYGITEDMAKEINMISDSSEYSRRVYELSQNLASNYY